MFYDSDRILPDRVQRFVDRYAVRLTTFDRRVRAAKHDPGGRPPEVVFVTGDSVAGGVMINDDETLASALQRRDPHRRYLNLGMGVRRLPRSAATSNSRLCATPNACAS